MDLLQTAYLMWLLCFFIDDLTYWFFVFNYLQIKLLPSLLFYSYLIFKLYIFQNKTFIGRSRIKIQFFVKEVNEGNPLIINTKRTILDVAWVLHSNYIFGYIPIQYKTPVP